MRRSFIANGGRAARLLLLRRRAAHPPACPRSFLGCTHMLHERLLPMTPRRYGDGRSFSARPNKSGVDGNSNEDGNGSGGGLLERYESLIESGEVARDPHQVRALAELDRLRRECLPYCDQLREKEDDEGGGDEDSWSSGLFSWSNPPTENYQPIHESIPPRGVYIHGGVGCGKTYCMDLFFDSLPTEERQKVHFHKFMLNIHKQMHNAKINQKLQGDEVVEYVIQSTLSEGRILCFDEFQVTDVADAMILKRLFTGLIQNGTVIVATSNRPPRDLYLGGLQRDLFLPFIDLLEEKCTVISMWESEMDYRLIQSDDDGDDYNKKKGAHKVYFVDDINQPGKARDSFEKLFKKLTKGSEIDSVILDVDGRDVFVPEASEEYSIARFSFYDLCGKARGAADYLAIGEKFHTIFIEHVPKLQLHEVNLVRRWITLIDALYECHVKVVVHSASTPEGMFQVDLENDNCDEVFAFDRTRSRMEEMRSEQYLKRKWVGAHDVSSSYARPEFETSMDIQM